MKLVPLLRQGRVLPCQTIPPRFLLSLRCCTSWFSLGPDAVAFPLNISPVHRLYLFLPRFAGDLSSTIQEGKEYRRQRTSYPLPQRDQLQGVFTWRQLFEMQIAHQLTRRVSSLHRGSSLLRRAREVPGIHLQTSVVYALAAKGGFKCVIISHLGGKSKALVQGINYVVRIFCEYAERNRYALRHCSSIPCDIDRCW